MIGLLVFAALGVLAYRRDLPRVVAAFLALGFWLFLLLAHLPYADEGWPLRGVAQVFGGDFSAWFFWGLVVGVVLAYRFLFRWMTRKRAVVGAAEAPRGPFAADELQRYARHIALREIGGPGQKRLKEARVLVVGAGGLGAPLLMYLAASGVGVIGVIDDDAVELTNLQRQIIHATERVGLPKVQSALLAMRALNPHVEVRPYNRRLTAEIVEDLLADYDLVLDGSDNFDTRYLVNAACVRAGKPLIAAAITQWEGQLSLYHPAAGGACYECLFPERPAPGMVPTCAEAGVAAPLPGVMGSLMALEAVKHLTGAGEGLRGRLMLFDGLEMETRVIRTNARVGCPVCGGKGPV
ncbi:HesA/MoeB/ThiF family protein [Neogemmobacter tilapiae]|uniref:Molybdopterin-synthase adenylyltransferase n=1 Tax=Neogemmobacter tilapiae TaxID=875041 RepID=A0A918TWQ9_9RHOB|nr:HesA/MoeB/ThiF family protein [Gemmobacter tilapiae]GHC65716.1 molybdopterin biosynthesis protein [Gemmobacter tilapiae]